MAKQAREFRRSGAGNCRLESLRLANDEVGGNSSVGPAAHAKFVRIGDPLRDGIIHHRHVVLKILVPPVSPDGFAVVLSIAGRSTWIWKQYYIAVRGEQLRQVIEFRVVGPHRTAVRPQYRGIFFSGPIV